MKKDRNCGMAPYPIYPMPASNMMMGMPMGAPMGAPMGMPMGMPSGCGGAMPATPSSQSFMQMQDNKDLSAQVANLEKRVSALENMVGTNSNYNTSNFQMM